MTIVELFLTETWTIRARGHTALATLAVVFVRFRQDREHVEYIHEKSSDGHFSVLTDQVAISGRHQPDRQLSQTRARVGGKMAVLPPTCRHVTVGYCS